MTVLGLDIGGANVKAATPGGQACCLPFALWKQPADLANFLHSEVLPRFETPNQIAITMTGELCDCFENKADGVQQILESSQQISQPAGIHVYSTSGTFLSPEQAALDPLRVAASNWHALANWSRRWIDPPVSAAILIDIGSTSCDIIPLNRESVLAIGTTDVSRIANHELVYTGAARTPVCAVANRIEFRGAQVPIAQELFASMNDVYLILGDIQEDPDNLETADHRPLTMDNSKRRLARMLCADTDELNPQELMDFANAIAEAQLNMINESMQRVLARLDTSNLMMLVSGSGSFLISKLVQPISLPVDQCLNLSERLGEQVCAAAPALATAVLLAESLSDSPR